MGIADSTSLRLSDDFVAGEVVIRYANPPSPSNRTLFDVDPTPLFDMTPVGGDVHREMRLTFGAGEETRSVFAALNLQPAVSAKSLDTAITGALQHKLDTLKVIKALRGRADVKSAAPNLKRPICMRFPTMIISNCSGTTIRSIFPRPGIFTRAAVM